MLFSCKKKIEYQKVKEQKSEFLSGKIIPDNHFLGDKKCKECHEQEYEKWKGSHHDKAMQIADSASVLGDFDNRQFTSQGVTSKFYKKNDDFYVNTEGPDGKNYDYKIVYTFGITPLQQYIVQFPNGHYQCLRTAWNTEKNKWFDLYPDFKVVHSEWLHWSRGGLNWNNMCADCHSTNVRKNYKESTHSYNTKYAIINVNCEACHGPGKQHVSEVEKLGERYASQGSLQMTSAKKPKELVDKCARCHMRREQVSEAFNFEGTLLDHYYPQLIEEGLYYPDGQILDEVYVYGSFLQSKMYQKGVTCTNCHDAHSLALKFDGNKLCTQCHVSEKYDTPKHHFHQQQTTSSKCINCHMTGKFYMGNDFRRDHSFRVPRPDLSLKYGSPNACSGCHKDKDDNWAWNGFKKLFGDVDAIHFSDKLASGIANEPNGHLNLIELMHDKDQPEIIRASATKVLSNYNIQNFIENYIKMLDDQSALVRGASLDVLSMINTKDYTNYFLPLLQDSKRSIRIKAFFGLASFSESEIPKKYQKDYQKVKKEFWIQMNANSDFVGTRARKGDYFFKKGQISKAIEQYESALALDEVNNQIRVNLATLYYKNQQYKEAENTYLEIIKQVPEYGAAYYALALLYSEMQRVDEAIIQLKKAVVYMPNNIRIYYNLGLLYHKKQDFKSAEKSFLSGLKIDNTNENLLYALAFVYVKHNKTEKAKNIILSLLDLYPNNQQYHNFLKQL